MRIPQNIRIAKHFGVLRPSAAFGRVRILPCADVLKQDISLASALKKAAEGCRTPKEIGIIILSQMGIMTPEMHIPKTSGCIGRNRR